MTDMNERPSSGVGSESAAVLDFSGVHRMVRGFLRKVEAAVSNLGRDPGRGKTMANLVLFGVNGLRFHHHVEDAEYWPVLVQKGADQAALEPLAAAHRELDPLLDDLEARARRLAAAPTDASAAAALSELVPGFCAHVRQHLDQEEPIMFPMLREHISNAEAHAMAARSAREAPREGLSWLMGGVTYAMTPEEQRTFLSAFPKPILWLRPLLLRRYRRNCATIGVAPEFG